MTMVLALIVTIGVLVTFHEYGHFWVARRCGVKVLRFSVGFGKPLVSWKDKQGTEFAIAAIPLGGYVKMLDAREGEVSPEEASQEFTSKPVWQRIAIVAAGPIANFLFAIFVYWILFMVGVVNLKPFVGHVMPGSPADQAGLASGVTISQVDNTQVQTWQDMSMALVERIGESGQIAMTTQAGETIDIPISDWLAGKRDPSPAGELGLSVRVLDEYPIIEAVSEGGRAQAAGIEVGDVLVAADGEAIRYWYNWVTKFQSSPETPIELEFERNGLVSTVSITPEAKQTDNGTIGFVGLGPKFNDIPDSLNVTRQYGPFDALVKATVQTWDTIALSLKLFGKMITGEISPNNLSGPISIAKMADQSAKAGLEPFVAFLAFISISLGVVNLLPVPVLDGGHLVYYLAELIRGKPLPERVQIIGFQIGASLLLFVMLFAIFNDFARL